MSDTAIRADEQADLRAVVDLKQPDHQSGWVLVLECGHHARTQRHRRRARQVTHVECAICKKKRLATEAALREVERQARVVKVLGVPRAPAAGIGPIGEPPISPLE